MPTTDCVICGQDHPRCNQHKKLEDGSIRPCMGWPRQLENLCKVHGASLPGQIAMGKRLRAARDAERDARAVLVTTGEEGVADPLAAMERIVQTQIIFAERLGQRVNDIEKLRFTSFHDNEQLRSELALYERANERAIKFLDVLMKHKPDGAAAAARSLLTDLAERLADAKPD